MSSDNMLQLGVIQIFCIVFGLKGFRSTQSLFYQRILKMFYHSFQKPVQLFSTLPKKKCT